jgi:hypothetical protein
MPEEEPRKDDDKQKKKEDSDTEGESCSGTPGGSDADSEWEGPCRIKKDWINRLGVGDIENKRGDAFRDR